MIGAWVVEIIGDEKRVSRGFYNFAALPMSGNRVTLMNHRGTLDVLGVVDVEHAPVAIAEGEALDQHKQPTATVYVQWIQEDEVREP